MVLNVYMLETNIDLIFPEYDLPISSFVNYSMSTKPRNSEIKDLPFSHVGRFG